MEFKARALEILHQVRPAVDGIDLAEFFRDRVAEHLYLAVLKPEFAKYAAKRVAGGGEECARAWLSFGRLWCKGRVSAIAREQAAQQRQRNIVWRGQFGVQLK